MTDDGRQPPIPVREIIEPADFAIRNHGSICLLYPLTFYAREWVVDNLPADRMLWGSAVVIEPRYVEDIVIGIKGDGLSINVANRTVN
jgi:hypothetical protein